ncbi:putative COPII coat assembly protein, Sec16 [Rosa chinensis]|uniref:Protein transport protein sec16 n=1 Tax=Rosa chinensis TaxID=74649 RepID=A0A2P6SFP6_ROSCH|nr:protein transport protein SEC16B homolog [Rosa chinensis]PRQ57499.1 putative COPII coat assembly protein, Sec16 [Rosa chinensis]
MASSAFELEDQTDEDFFDKLIDDDDIDFSGYANSSVGKAELDVVKDISKLSVSDVGTGGRTSSQVNGELGQKGGVVLEPSDLQKESLTGGESESSALVAKGEEGVVDDTVSSSVVSVDGGLGRGDGVNGQLGHGDGVVLASLDRHQDPMVSEASKSSVPENRDEAVEDKASNEGGELEGKGEDSPVDNTVRKSAVSEGTGVKVVQWSSFNSDPSGGSGFGSYSDFFSEVGGNSEDPFANLGNTDQSGVKSIVSNGVLESSVSAFGNSSYVQHQEDPFANLGNTVQFGAESVVTNGVLENAVSGFDTFSYGQQQEDPFADLGNADQFGAKSAVSNVVLENSGSGLGASIYGKHQEDPFANLGNTDQSGAESNMSNGILENSVSGLGTSSYGQHQEGQFYGAPENQNLDGQQLNSNQNWENLYPGWRYDPNTEQWYPLEGYDVNSNTNAEVNNNANAQESFNVNSQSADTEVFSAQKADAPYLQQAVQAVSQSVVEASETSTVSNWNQHSYGNTEYPAHMVFDPQYPGWYYDTNIQEWRQLEPSVATIYHDQQNTSTWHAENVAKSETIGFTENQEWRQLQPFTPSFDQSTTSMVHNQQYNNTNVDNHGSQSPIIQQSVLNWDGSMTAYDQQNTSLWHAQKVAKSDTVGFTEKQAYMDRQFSTEHAFNSVNQQTGFNPSGSIALHQDPSQGNDISSATDGFERFNYANFSQPQDQAKEPNQAMHFSPANFGSQKPVQFFQQPLQTGTQFSHDAREGRSSAGRPAHALVTFGFGGKLILMKNNSSFHANQTYGSQGSVEGVINVLNLMDVVTEKSDAANFGTDGCDYFSALCQQSFPGPLVGGNVGNKELNKWIDDKIANCETSHLDFKKGDHLRLLFSLLKISWQFYGKLRSPFGTDQRLKDIDNPESALAKLFASAKRSNEYGALTRCMHNLPSEAQIQATALEVQKLLVSGRKDEALQCAQEGQLWGPALVIASQLGDQFYCDTVKHMAVNQLIAGSPLRTLCLLIARQPADVFSDATTNSSFPSFTNLSQRHEQVGANYMLDDWEENLAILTANRTKDDELVIIHLGDSLWKDRGQITAAHICYLVAEANLEQYSNSSRLCLIGADHWKFPRTYASPEAIQRTELYEYSKVVGNPQFLLLPFQPYKLIYAHMLAEVGKLADSLKYCQAILKSLKTARAPEVDTWRELVSSLEERIRAHQQGGYSINLAPTKLMGKLRTFIDSTAHRVVGGLPPPIPSTAPGFPQLNEHSHQLPPPIPSTAPGFPQLNEHAHQLPPPIPSTAPGFAQLNEHAHQPGNRNVPNSQSTMVMSSLMPSASMEPISERTSESNQLNMPNRSISEPDFGKSPSKVDSSKKVNSKTQQKPSASSGSRFSFGSQIFQKTLGLVIKSRPDKQAKLGEANKFYYDEKLKRWVEEGAEPPAEEAALPPPPPTTAAIQNRMQDYNMNDALKTTSFHAVGGPEIKSPASSESSGAPPVPPSSNQFSARGRMGVRSRYVDTFNKGGATPGNLFQPPSLPAAKPGGGSNPKFFIPSPVTSYQETVQTTEGSTQESFVTSNNPPKSVDTFSAPPTSTPSSMTMQRFPSMDNIVQKRAGELTNGSSFVPPESRRVASWSGSLSEASNPSVRSEIKPTALGMSPLSYMPSFSPSMQSERSSGSLGDDLHEVEL